MATVVEKVSLVFSDARDNHNKVWYGTLYDDGTVLTEWGRVGYGLQSNSKFMGPHKFHKLVAEKHAKGYTELKVIGDAPKIATPDKSDLHRIATSQIAKSGDQTLLRLVKQLVDANVHRITSSTQLQYNSSTGLFSTPLGIVTIDAIIEARKLLDRIADCINQGCSDSIFGDYVSRYLRLIPHAIGMKFDARRIFPDITSISKESDILDSLEASYKAVMASPVTTTDNQPVEQVFQVDIDVARGREADRIVQWFEHSKDAGHGYNRVKVVNIFEVKIHDMDQRFASKIGNIEEVFHGTSQANCLSILKGGLRVSPPSSAAIAGKMFGNGIYGAKKSSKSLGYTYGRWGQGGVGDSGWLFVCSFAMGKVLTVDSSAQPRPGYDSVWARAGRVLRHDELIVYRDNQVNIRYLLECK
jgi:poly [ADP-ribose] polymerase 2/3/4